MTDALDRAVDARIDAYRPDAVPPFGEVEARKRRRDRRRLAVAGTALPAAALALAFAVVPRLDGRGAEDRLVPPGEGPRPVYAGQTRTDPVTGERTRVYTLPAVADRPAGTSTCLALRGVMSMQLQSDPPRDVATVTGRDEIDAFERCVARVPGLAIPELRPEGASAAAPASEAFPWTGARICLSDPPGACRRLGADDARALHQALAVDSRKEVDANVIYDCVRTPKVYRMTFEHPSVLAVPIIVPTVCGPMRIGDLALRAYEVDQATRDAVEAAFDAGSPAEARSQAEISACRDVHRALRAVTPERVGPPPQSEETARFLYETERVVITNQALMAPADQHLAGEAMTALNALVIGDPDPPPHAALADVTERLAERCGDAGA